MSDLTLPEFLLAHIKQDERLADVVPVVRFSDTPPRIESHSPARVRAECESKRRIVEEHRLADWEVQGHPVCETCVSPDDWTVVDLPEHLIYPCRTLRHMGTVYATDFDYREEWRP